MWGGPFTQGGARCGAAPLRKGKQSEPVCKTNQTKVRPAASVLRQAFKLQLLSCRAHYHHSVRMDSTGFLREILNTGRKVPRKATTAATPSIMSTERMLNENSVKFMPMPSVIAMLR